jgi:hypothetical protein
MNLYKSIISTFVGRLFLPVSGSTDPIESGSESSTLFVTYALHLPESVPIS